MSILQFPVRLRNRSAKRGAPISALRSPLRIVVTMPPTTGTPREYRYAFGCAVRAAVIRAVVDHRLDPALAEECYRATTTEVPRR
jgi:hypothetical protein